MRDASSSRKSSAAELRFLEALRRRCPENGPLLEALGHLYTHHGRYEEGLDVDLRLTRMRPTEPEYWYNLACSYALTRKPAEAIDALRKAAALGYTDADWMASDEDLKSIREHPAFAALLEQVRRRDVSRS